ncbi:hypothetical protein [Faecalibacterium hattorii]|uniref:hypothetical protein n=1 Tax=Faecalibacterium hattorii TaxID=2935520 RepID=UPI003AAF4BC0
MVEMTEVAEILRNATAKSLVLDDRSQQPRPSTARRPAPWSNTSQSPPIGATLFATHYHELRHHRRGEELQHRGRGAQRRSITFRDRSRPADEHFSASRSRTSAGLPGSVTRRAHEVLRAQATLPDKVEQMRRRCRSTLRPLCPARCWKARCGDADTINFLYELKDLEGD